LASTDAHYIILGYGRLGSKLAAILLDRGAQVSVLDPYAKAELEHPNFTLYPLAGTTIEDLEKVGFPKKVVGIIIVAGKFSVNASILFGIEKFASQMDDSDKDYLIVVRARNAEEKEILMEHAARSQEEIYVIYSEETGANAVAAEMGILVKQKHNFRLRELNFKVEGDGSTGLIDLLRFYENQKIDVLNELVDFQDGITNYQAVLGEISKSIQNKLKKLAASIDPNYTLVELPPVALDKAAEKAIAYNI
jgi:voltage-gated potassium channel Kch